MMRWYDTKPRPNVRTTTDDLLAAQAAKRLALSNPHAARKADLDMWMTVIWIILYGMILPAGLAVIGKAWWGW